MEHPVKVWLRTFQNQFPAAKRLKDEAYRYSRQLLRIPHESDFKILPMFPDTVDDLFLDIGANHGQSIASIRLFKPNTRLISFEPNPLLYRELLQNYTDDNALILRPYGLGESAGEFTLFVPVYNGFVYDGLASLNREEAEQWLSADRIVGFDPNKLVIEEVSCRIETLDAQMLSPTFIKIDVQGLEYEVLKGGITTLQRCEPVILLEGLSGSPKLQDFIHSLGYEVYRYWDGLLVPSEPLGDNNFLLTRARYHELFGSGGSGGKQEPIHHAPKQQPVGLSSLRANWAAI